jgi:hypothetical protein
MEVGEREGGKKEREREMKRERLLMNHLLLKHRNRT